MPRTEGINVTAFQGGLNLRANEFSLAEDESPDILNVEVDPRGGVQSRQGWERWNTADVTADAWDPRHAYVHELSSGLDAVLVTNGTSVHRSSNGTFTKLTRDGGVPFVVGAPGHLADFAPWGDNLYIAAGTGQNAARWDGVSANAVGLADVSPSNWNADYLAPTTGHAPRAKFITSHNGRMWCAGTVENGVSYPHRVRWSHPNQPESWKEDDRHDLLEGGGPITAIVPFGDHLLIFKRAAIFAIFGYGADDLQVVEVSRTEGALSRATVARTEDAVYFCSWPSGVFRISEGNKPVEISTQLRPMLKSADFNTSLLQNQWLGWVGRRLWWSVPYLPNEVATDAATSFVFDPTLGSWTAFRSAEGGALGPFAAGGYGQASVDLYGFDRTSANIVRVDVGDVGTDNITGTPAAFPTRYTTRWLHGNYPDLKKRWTRPTVIAREESNEYRLQVAVFADFKGGEPKRQFGVTVSPSNAVVSYDSGYLYDDGHVYGLPTEGSKLRKASSLGTMAAVQVQIDGEPGKPWGLDGIIFKYKPRNFR